IVASPTSPFWVSANGTGLSALYNGNGLASATVITIPGAAGVESSGQQCGTVTMGSGAPSGVIFNNTTSFMLGASPASFIFSSEQGVIAGWNGAAGKAGNHGGSFGGGRGLQRPGDGDPLGRAAALCGRFRQRQSRRV